MSELATLTPNVVHLGAVMGGSRRMIRLMNVSPGAIELTSVSLPEGLGVSLISFPTVVQQGFGYDFEVVVRNDAPRKIEGELEIFINGGASSVVLQVDGFFAAVLPPMVNWAEPLEATWEFKTDEFTSRSGKSQRRALRRTPRRTFSYRATLNGQAKTLFNAAIAAWQHKFFMVPDVTLGVTSPLGLPAYAQATVVEGRPDWLGEGSDVLIVDGDIAEHRYVAGVFDEAEGYSRVDFAFATATVFSKNCRVYPALIGRMADTFNGTSRSGAVTEYSIRFEVDPGSERYREPPAAPMLYDEVEVFTLRPNWAEGIDLTHEHDFDKLDYGSGVIVYGLPVAFGRRISKMHFALPDWPAAQTLLDTFYRARGRRGEFYVPTHENDLVLMAPLLAGTNYLVADGVGLAKFLGGDTVYRAVAVFLRDGTVVCNRVRSITAFSEASSRVVCQDEWPRGIAVDEITAVSWLLLTSFASDGLTLTWKTASSAEAEVSFTTRENNT
jgi:hypothetical protein